MLSSVIQKRKRAVSALQESPLREIDVSEGDPASRITCDPATDMRRPLVPAIPIFDFNCVQSGRARLMYDSGLGLALDAYPRCKSVEQSGVFLFLSFDTGDLPPRPRPITIAGLAAVFIENEQKPSWYGKRGGARRICDEFVLQDRGHSIDIEEPLLERIFAEIPLAQSVTNMGPHLIVEIDCPEKEVPRSLLKTLPRVIGQQGALYRSMAKSTDLMRRRKERVTVLDTDHSDYWPQLRPGIMVNSSINIVADDESQLQREGTTLGIAVEKDDRVFVLVAEQGFRAEENKDDRVFHPSKTDHLIGIIESRNRDTDLAKAELSEDVVFNNDEYFNVIQAPRVRFATKQECNSQGLPLIFDAPWSGPVYSVIGGIKKFRKDLDGDKTPRRAQIMLWQGIDAEEPPNGICGSTMFLTERSQVEFVSCAAEPASEQLAVCQYHLYEGEGVGWATPFVDHTYNIPRGPIRGTRRAEDLVSQFEKNKI